MISSAGAKKSDVIFVSVAMIAGVVPPTIPDAIPRIKAVKEALYPCLSIAFTHSAKIGA